MPSLRRTSNSRWHRKAGFDGFWELKLKPWDTAAGCLMVEEAGGMISDLFGGKWNLSCPYLLASNGIIHQPMIHVLKTA